jgi:hypothetical protein
MGAALALALYLALTIGLAYPLLPLARRLARLCIKDWKDAVLAVVFMLIIGLVTFYPAALVGLTIGGVLTLLLRPIIVPIGAMAEMGQGVLVFWTVWIGPWAVAVFCAGCLANFYLDAWWNRGSS